MNAVTKMAVKRNENINAVALDADGMLLQQHSKTSAEKTFLLAGIFVSLVCSSLCTSP